MTRVDKGVYIHNGYYVYKGKNGKWVLRNGFYRNVDRNIDGTFNTLEEVKAWFWRI